MRVVVRTWSPGYLIIDPGSAVPYTPFYLIIDPGSVVPYTPFYLIIDPGSVVLAIHPLLEELLQGRVVLLLELLKGQGLG